MNPNYFVRTSRYVHIDEHMLHLTSVKIDHPQMSKICLSSKQDYISKLAYLQEILSNLNVEASKFKFINKYSESKNILTIEQKSIF